MDLLLDYNPHIKPKMERIGSGLILSALAIVTFALAQLFTEGGMIVLYVFTFFFVFGAWVAIYEETIDRSIVPQMAGIIKTDNTSLNDMLKMIKTKFDI